MQLSVRQTAAILRVSEDMVYHWIRNNGLPATRSGNRRHINRIKLMEWAHQNGISMEVEGEVESPVLENALMQGKRLLKIDTGSLEQVVDSLAEAVSWPANESVGNVKLYLKAREDCGFIPHTSGVLIPRIDSPIIVAGAKDAVHIALFANPLIFADKKYCGLLAVVSSCLNAHTNLMNRLLISLADQKFIEILKAGADLDAMLSRLRQFGQLLEVK